MPLRYDKGILLLRIQRPNRLHMIYQNLCFLLTRQNNFLFNIIRRWNLCCRAQIKIQIFLLKFLPHIFKGYMTVPTASSGFFDGFRYFCFLLSFLFFFLKSSLLLAMFRRFRISFSSFFTQRNKNSLLRNQDGRN